MTDPTIISTIVVAAIAAVPPTLLALATLMQSRANHVQGAGTRDAVNVGVAKVDQVSVQTNGTLSQLRLDLQQSREETAAARAELIELRTAMLKHGIGDRRTPKRKRK